MSVRHDLSPDAVAVIEWGEIDIEIRCDGSTVARDGETGAEIAAPLRGQATFSRVS